VALGRHGAATLSSDAVVHELYREPRVRDAVATRFGPGVVGADGEIDRTRLGVIAFGDAEALGFLERLLHPLVAVELERWRDLQAAGGAPLLVHEVPLLFEAGLEGRYDRVVLVTAPDDVRRARVGPDFDRRSARQLPEDEKRRRADEVVDNTGPLEELDAWAADLVRRLGR
jgi:dephospho-CoA kinase